jgi:hypothetical protein
MSNAMRAHVLLLNTTTGEPGSYNAAPTLHAVVALVRVLRCARVNVIA